MALLIAIWRLVRWSMSFVSMAPLHSPFPPLTPAFQRQADVQMEQEGRLILGSSAYSMDSARNCVKRSLFRETLLKLVSVIVRALLTLRNHKRRQERRPTLRCATFEN
jgi:hypothetical protein